MPCLKITTQKIVIVYTGFFFPQAKKCKDSDHKRIDIDWTSVEEAKWSQPEEQHKLKALQEDEEETYRNTVYNHECWNSTGWGKCERGMQMAAERHRRLSRQLASALIWLCALRTAGSWTSCSARRDHISTVDPVCYCRNQRAEGRESPLLHKH